MSSPQVNQTKKKYDTVYEPRDDDKIFFGKYKNQPHKLLKDDAKYCDWIMNTEKDFAESTKWYIKNKVWK